MRALLIPAEPHRQPVVLALDDDLDKAADEIEAILGPMVEDCKFDDDSLMLVADNGMAEGLSKNRRATHYIKNASDAAKQGRMRNASASYGIYGDTIVLGETADGALTDVPQRMVDLFTGPEHAPTLEL